MAKKPWRVRRGVWELLEDTPTNRKEMKIAISGLIDKGKKDQIKGILIGGNKHRIGALDKYQKGEVPYITFRDTDAKAVSTAARVGSGKAQTSLLSEPYTDKTRVGMVDEFIKGSNVVPTTKIHGHHIRMLQMYRPFFEGLNGKDRTILADWAVQNKFPLGNAKANIAMLDEDFHHQIHKFMIEKGYQVRKGLPVVEGLPNLGNTVEERIVALQHFFTNVQEPIEKELSRIKWDQQAKYNPPSEAEVQNQLAYLNDKETALEAKRAKKLSKVDDIEVGRRLGGIGDTLKIGSKARWLIPAATGAGMFLTGIDARAREQKAQETGHWLDKVQAGISKVELAADTVGAVPNPASLYAEPTGLVAGLTNTAIDVARDINFNETKDERLEAAKQLQIMK